MMHWPKRTENEPVTVTNESIYQQIFKKRKITFKLFKRKRVTKNLAFPTSWSLSLSLQFKYKQLSFSIGPCHQKNLLKRDWRHFLHASQNYYLLTKVAFGTLKNVALSRSSNKVLEGFMWFTGNFSLCWQ